MDIAAVFTAAMSRLPTEIPQTDFCFDHLKGTPFPRSAFLLFVSAQFNISQLILLEVACYPPNSRVSAQMFDYICGKLQKEAFIVILLPGLDEYSLHSFS